MAWLILLIVAWGALAFGAIYDWARWPLVVACVVAGAWGFARAVPRERRRVNRPILARVGCWSRSPSVSNWSRSRAARYDGGVRRRMSS